MLNSLFPALSSWDVLKAQVNIIKGGSMGGRKNLKFWNGYNPFKTYLSF